MATKNVRTVKNVLSQVKGANCTKDECRNKKSVKKKDWCFSSSYRSYTEKYIFYDFECTKNTGTHVVNLAIAQDYNIL